MTAEPTESGVDGDRRVSVDGEIVPAGEATVSVADRGFRYGDAACERIRAYGGEPFRWPAHAARLADTCEALGLDHGLAESDLQAWIDETLAANDFDDALLRLSITRGVQPGGIDPDPAVDPTVVVTAEPRPRGGVDSRAAYDGPAALQTTKTRKPSSRALPANAGTHNALNAILARLELRVTGADEALMLDPEGAVAGGATAALFFADGTSLKTPALDGPVAPGVTRATVIDIAESEGIPVEEGAYTPDTVREADEVFLTSSTWGIRPVQTVDGLAVDGDGDEVEGPLTTLLSRLFDRRVEARYYGGERE